MTINYNIGLAVCDKCLNIDTYKNIIFLYCLDELEISYPGHNQVGIKPVQGLPTF